VRGPETLPDKNHEISNLFSVEKRIENVRLEVMIGVEDFTERSEVAQLNKTNFVLKQLSCRFA